MEDRTVPAIVTSRLLDINPISIDGAPAASEVPGAPPFDRIEYNGAVYFQGNDQPPGFPDFWGYSGGPELWKTDGTAAGTVLIKDIQAGFYGSYPGDFTVSGGTLFFSADDGVHGSELWKTDGTAAGTVMVKNIYGQTPNLEDHSSYPSDLTDINGVLYFAAEDVDSTDGLWRSDGTAAGTYLIKHFTPPANYPGGLQVADLTNVNGTLFFTAPDGAGGRELWKSDGTAAGTVVVADCNPAGVQANLISSRAVGSTFYFSFIGDETNGEELWKSDGTAAGTVLVKDINPGGGNSQPRSLTDLNGILYFRATSGGNRDELWRSDGTPDGTYPVAQLGSDFDKLNAPPLVVANGKLYALSWAGNGNQLWVSDGTAAGTRLVTTVGRNPADISSTLYWLTAVAGGVDFVGYSAAAGSELWHSNGTAAGTGPVADINPGDLSSSPENLLVTSFGLSFTADDGTHGREMWTSDDTAAGTALVKDINTVTRDGLNYAGFTALNGQVLFAANDGRHGTELWRTDGTAGGTSLVKDIDPGPGSALLGTYDEYFAPVALDGVLYFAADDGTHGRELWRSDGTSAGTYLVKDLWPGATSSDPENFIAFDGAVYFTEDYAGTRGFWRTDGTAAGTVLLAANLGPKDFTISGGILYFVGAQGTGVNPSPYGVELWKTDGTVAGTIMVKDVWPGINNGLGTTSRLVDVNGTLFFDANDGSHGSELWRSDGTAAGTVMVKDIAAGTNSGATLFSSAVMNGVLYFGGSTVGAVGESPQLWRSDGTDAGTYQVANVIIDGPGNSVVFTLQSMAVLNGQLVFQGASDDDFELWRSDGTAYGTAMVKNIMVPTPFLVFGSGPALMTPFNGRVYFSADDWYHGRELWETDGTTAGTVMTDLNAVPLDPAGTYDLPAYPGELTDINGTLYFSAEDGRAGREIWTVAVVSPAATVGPISPDPRNTPVDAVTITFSEPVTGFDLGDLSLTRDGSPVSLSGAALATTDNTTFTLSGLTGLTAGDGAYALRIAAAGSGILDADQISMAADATATWVMDTTSPHVTGVALVGPDLRNTPVDAIDVTFSEPIDVSTFTAADLALTRDGGAVPLAGVTVSPLSGSTYRVSELGGVTAAEGTYQLAVDGRGIDDPAGNAGTGAVSTGWVTDTTPPTVASIAPVGPDPRNTPADEADVTFSEPIDPATLTGSDVSLTLDGAPVGLTGLTFTAVSGTEYRVGGLAPFTAAEGVYLLTVDAAGVADPAGNVGTGTGSVAWTMDITPPAVTVGQAAGQADPTNGPARFDVAFSEPVLGFDASKIDLSASTAGGPLSASVAQSDPTHFVVTVTGMTTSGVVVAAVDGRAVTDPAGNANTASVGSDDSVTFDNVPPAVTINRAAGQPETTVLAPVRFDVAFSEPVVGFDAPRVDLSGTTAPGATASVTDLGDRTHFTVEVSGMTAGGTVVASVDADVVADLAGNPNLSATTSGNSVAYVRAGAVVFSAPAYSVSRTGAPVLLVTVRRVGGSEGSLSVDYATADGTASAGTDYVSASGNLSWTAGDATDRTIQIPIIDPATPEPDVDFAIHLTNADPAGAIGDPATSVVTVRGSAALAFALTSFPAAEGHAATVTVRRLVNASGPVSVDYATADGTAAAGADYVSTAGTLAWADGDSSDKTFTVPIIDDGLSEGRETVRLSLSNPTGNALLGTPSAVMTVAPSDGTTVVGVAPSPVSRFVDADGDRVAVGLGGKVGILTYYLTDGIGPISEIDLSGTDPTKSTVSVAVARPRGGSGDGRIDVGEVDGSGFKSFTAQASDVTGAGFNLSGFAGSITVGDVTGGADFRLPAPGPTARSGVSITAGVIGDDTDIVVAAPLRSLTAIAVGRGGAVSAPSVGTIVVRGHKATKTVPAVSGDFGADVTVSGSGVDPVKGKALKSLSVAGAVSGATISVGGNVGSVTAGAFVGADLFAGYAGADDGTGTFTGAFTVGPISVKAATNGFVDSSVIATSIKKVVLASATTANGGTKFGFVFHGTAGGTFGGLTVKSPTLSYDKRAGGTQMLGGDLEVEKL